MTQPFLTMAVPTSSGRSAQSHDPRPFLAATGTLYVSFGLIFGLVQGGLPPLLRARGFDMHALGGLFILLLPFGLTFLWAPLVDAARPVRSAPRIGWIVAAQGVIAVLLAVVSLAPAWPPLALLAIGLAVAFAAATMDVALDALTTAAMPASHRTLAGSVKVGALAFGSMIGGGVFVIFADDLGWARLFAILAGLTIVATIPIIVQRRWDEPALERAPASVGLKRAFVRPGNGRRLALLTLTSCVLVPMIGLNRIMLVDAGVPLATIGQTVGLLSPLASLASSALAVPLLARLGTARSAVAFMLICVAALGTMMTGCLWHLPDLALGGAIAATAGASGFYVLICALILTWAQGPRPATDYAVLYGMSRLAATVWLIGLTRVIPTIGWPIFYGVTLLVVITVGAALAFKRVDWDSTITSAPAETIP